MAWLKIDDNAPHHHKMLAAGDVACWLWLCGLAYCQRHMSDGLIPQGAIRFLGCAGWKQAVAKLVDAGLWEDELPLGYRVHNFLKWNDSAEHRLARTEKSEQRVAKYRQKKRECNSVTVACQSRIGNTTPTPQPQPLPTPLPKDQELRARFAALWAVYPRKVGKEAAFSEFAKIAPDGSLVEVMVGAVERQRQSPQWLKDGGQFIPHPRTWLKQGRWQDDVDLAEPIAKPMTEFERERHERHQRAIAQQIEYARKREQAS